MFIETDTFDVIPHGCLVAEETLIYFSLFDPGDGYRNHLKVHHVVTGRRLMTLGTTL